jgi:UDP-N-acetylmuramate dehydrogenase
VVACASVALPIVPVRLADLTTLRLGGVASDVVRVDSADTLVAAVRQADRDAVELLLVGGGSNLVAADEGWAGRLVSVRSTGIAVAAAGDAKVDLTVQAGQPWDEVVTFALDEGLSGLETMSGIPGLTGATPVQNVGAYGAEIADVLVAVRVYDRVGGAVETWDRAQCRFGFRTSAFKHTDRYVVLDVTLRLTRRAASVPIRYAELARRLDLEPGASTDPRSVRAAVLDLRRSKGMLLDEFDHDTWSVGSFFVNPLLATVPAAAADCPQWATDGATKLSAAWLIEQAGFHRGYGNDRVAVSTKHTLALTNRGGATTADLLDLAAEIRAGVENRFGIRLGPEAHLAPNVTF